MAFEKIRNLFNKDETVFDMFNNKDNDECKTKYNYLIYFMLEYFMNDENNLSIKEKQYYDRVLNYNKEAILLYLYVALDILGNQDIDEKILDSEDLSSINDLKGNLDVNSLKGKMIIVNQIRNAFAHKSGKVNFYIDNGVKKVRIDNKNWFSIDTKVEDLNSLFSNIIVKNDNNKIQKEIIDTIDKIKRSEYDNITDNSIIILMINLLMCYNKESVFDQYMLGQSSFIDASMFSVNSTENWNFINDRMQRNFFDKFNIDFYSDKDKSSYESEWKAIYDIESSFLRKDNNYIYDTSKMPIDSYTNKHIPIPIFLRYIRDANSHGRIEINGDNFTFYDNENGIGAKPYFYMSINKDDLINFIFSDYFVESLLTPIKVHKNLQQNNLYLLERAQSANEFSNYINVYKNRMPNLSEVEVIKYMYDNNKFSSYLMEYPEQVDTFLNYQLSDGRKLTDVLCDFSNSQKDKFNNININKKDIYKYKNHCLDIGYKLYAEWFLDSFEKSKDPNFETKKHYGFFVLLYLFQSNLKSIHPNNILSKDDGFDKIDSSVLNESEYLQKEIMENDIYFDDSQFSKRILIEVGMQQSRKNELDKIILACALNKAIKKKENATEEQKESEMNITNVNKRSNLARGMEKSSYENVLISNYDMKKRAKLVALNVGTHVINGAIAVLATRNSADPALVANTLMVTYPTSIFLINLALRKTWEDVLKDKKRINNNSSIFNKYSEKNLGGMESEIKDNGSSRSK